jgi:hypothetical protein
VTLCNLEHGDAAAEKYRQATTRVGDAVDDPSAEGGVYAKALSAVVRGAEDVKERAIEAQTDLDQSARTAAAPFVVRDESVDFWYGVGRREPRSVPPPSDFAGGQSRSTTVRREL